MESDFLSIGFTVYYNEEECNYFYHFRSVLLTYVPIYGRVIVHVESTQDGKDGAEKLNMLLTKYVISTGETAQAK